MRSPPLSVGRSLRRLFFVGYLIVQLAVPLTVLAAGEEPARWGWQMFSMRRSALEVHLVLEGGEREAVDLLDYVVNPRADVRYERHLPPHLCRVRSDARAVVILGDEGEERLPC